ncbi:MAG: hypothetical protein EBV01_14635 [Betaproteobacteria bacterium]|nr:hypothetical protein [Betaproteobacteria bacterium]NBP40538.1 hypothetical protein [Betaproteobacteria bacterium]NBQ80111.1 hypothetical protein [Betaproteobacteria bacterium]NBS40685.1 hypothetical protein [Betaproteobacteria bacterium]NBT82999.1 hypothetical protein [Betaproteobacteria bacterium]
MNSEINAVPALLALFLSSLLGATGQVLLKLGAANATLAVDYLNPRTAIGLLFYGIGTVLWIWSLTRLPLKVAYGFTALTFALVYLASYFVLGERFSTQTLVGVGTVLLGFMILVTSH